MSTKIIFFFLLFFILTSASFSLDDDNSADIAAGDMSSDSAVEKQSGTNIFISDEFIYPGYYKNKDTGAYFKFTDYLMFFSKLDGEFFSYDLSGDTVIIKDAGLAIKLNDDKTLYVSNLLYSGYYSLLNVYETALLESGLTGSTDDKINILTAAINSANNPIEDAAGVYNRRGEVFCALEQVDDAIEDFSKAIEIDPQNKLYYQNRAYAYIYKGDNEEAYSDINDAIETDPDKADEFLYFVRGGLNFLKGSNSEAIGDFDRSIVKYPEFTEAYGLRGNAYVKTGEYANAIRDFSKVIELDPDLLEAYRNRGTVYAKIRDYVNAFADFEKAGVIPEESYENIAGYYFEKAEFENAKKFYDLAIAVKPSPESFLFRGFIGFAAGDYKQSLSDYDKAIELRKDYYQAYNYRGILLFVQNQYKPAIEDFTKAIELNNTVADSYLLRLACASYAGKAEYKKFLDISHNAIAAVENVWQKSLIEFFTDAIDTASLLYAAMSEKNSIKERMSVTYFFIALKNQLKGMNSNAKTSYRISVDAKSTLNYSYHLSLARLKKMK